MFFSGSSLTFRRPPEIDPIVWIGIASCAGALAPTAPLPTIAVALLTGVLLARIRDATNRRSARVAIVLGAVVFAGASLRAQLVVLAHERARAAMVAKGPWPARCVLSGAIASSPTLLGGGLRVDVDATEIHCRDGPPLHGRVMLHLPIDDDDDNSPSSPSSPRRSDGGGMPILARGDVVSATASIAPPYRFWNDGTGDPRPSAARRATLLSGGADEIAVVHEGFGIRWAIDRVRSKMRARIVATFPKDTAPMARALVLGEDDLASDDGRAFRRSGLAHLLAVSGMHLVLVVMGIVAALRALLLRVPWLAHRFDVLRMASAIGIPIAWIYADLAGGSGSALRAAWMCTVALLARALARKSSPWRALGLSLVAMSALDPLVAFDLSFVLSALATTGILLLARPIEERVSKKISWMPAFITKPFATTAAATIACAPVIALMSPDLPVGGLIANVLAVPVGDAAALPLCLVHAILFVWPDAELGCAVVASGALSVVRFVARTFTSTALPIPSPTADQIGAMASMAVGAALGRPRAALGFGVLAVLALEVGVRMYGAPHGVLRATFIDVGQGDAALVDFPDGSAMLIDGGGLVGSPVDVGERAVAPLLNARRRSAIDIVVLSHPHPDHFLGLGAALTRSRVKELWDTGQGEIDFAAAAAPPSPSATTGGTAGATRMGGTSYPTLLADLRARDVKMRRPEDLCGTQAIGGAMVDVLAPCPGIVSDRGANDNSFVIRIRFGDRAFLFVGDAEREEESEIVRRIESHALASDALRADVLKVGHHGSRTSSSPAFLEAVRPTVAVISCGVRNRFGHPHPTTLDVLAHAGVRTLRTDRHGSVVITTNGVSLEVESMTPR